MRSLSQPASTVSQVTEISQTRVSSDTHPSPDIVRQYYAQLAAEYNSRANQTCENSYQTLVLKYLSGCESVMEVGCGSSHLLRNLNPSRAVGCDLTLQMLKNREKGEELLIAGAGEKLPFQASSFDGVFLINVLEHVADPSVVISECARVLKKGGTWLAVTPNGNWELLLDIVERLRLKIPEGPHSFLTQQNLYSTARKWLEVLEHRTFLTFPTGPIPISRWIDDRSLLRKMRFGFFQFLVGKKF